MQVRPAAPQKAALASAAICKSPCWQEPEDYSRRALAVGIRGKQQPLPRLSTPSTRMGRRAGPRRAGLGGGGGEGAGLRPGEGSSPSPPLRPLPPDGKTTRWWEGGGGRGRRGRRGPGGGGAGGRGRRRGGAGRPPRHPPGIRGPPPPGAAAASPGTAASASLSDRHRSPASRGAPRPSLPGPHGAAARAGSRHWWRFRTVQPTTPLLSSAFRDCSGSV